MVLDRPDAILSDLDGRVLLVKEDKCEDMDNAKQLLDIYVQHLFEFEPEVTPNHIFGYTLAHQQAILWLYQRNDMRNGIRSGRFSSSTDITSYNLSDIRDRIRLTTNILCLYVICENESRKLQEK